MTPPVYVINMDRASERWARVSDRLAELGLCVYRVSALDALTRTNAVLGLRGLRAGSDGRTLRISTADGRPYSVAEEGCFQSHIKALEAFLDSDSEHAVIAEDDIVPLADFTAVVTRLADLPGLEIVKLEAAIWSGARYTMPVARVAGRMLVASFRASSGSACYLIGRRGAEKLLAASPNHFAAYDEFLCDTSAHRAQVLDIAPMIAEQEKQDTDVHDPALATRGPLPLTQRLRFAARKLRRRVMRIWMSLSAGSFAVWRIQKAPWWAP